jgi:ribonuclease P protein component
MVFSCAAARRTGARSFARGGQRDASAWPSRLAPCVLANSKQARQPRFGLGVERRLARKADFERLLREGSRKSRSGYALFFLARVEGPPRLGILISRKHAARATVRNRIKRCIREAFRLEQEALGALDVLVRPPYGAKPGAPMLVRLRGLFSGLRQ